MFQYWITNKVDKDLTISEKNNNLVIVDGDNREIYIKIKDGKYDTNKNQTFHNIAKAINEGIEKSHKEFLEEAEEKEEEINLQKIKAVVGGDSKGINKDLKLIIVSEDFIKLSGNFISTQKGFTLLKVNKKDNNKTMLQINIDPKLSKSVSINSTSGKSYTLNQVEEEGQVKYWEDNHSTRHSITENGMIRFRERDLKHSTKYEYTVRVGSDLYIVERKTSGDGYFETQDFIEYQKDPTQVYGKNIKRLEVSKNGNYLLMAETVESLKSKKQFRLYLYDVGKSSKQNIADIPIVSNVDHFKTFGFRENKDGETVFYYFDKDYNIVLRGLKDSDEIVEYAEYREEGIESFQGSAQMNRDFLNKGFLVTADNSAVYFSSKDNRSLLEMKGKVFRRLDFIGFDEKDVKEVKILSKLEGKMVFIISIKEIVEMRETSSLYLLDFEEYTLESLTINDVNYTENLKNANSENYTLLKDSKDETYIKTSLNIISFSDFYDMKEDSLLDGQEIILEEVEKEYENLYMGMNHNHTSSIIKVTKGKNKFESIDFYGMKMNHEYVLDIIDEMEDFFYISSNKENSSNVSLEMLYKEGYEDKERLKELDNNVENINISGTKGIAYILQKEDVLKFMNIEY